MATVNSNHFQDQLQRYFSNDVCQQLEQEDSVAGKTVSLILIAIIGGGLISMAISLWFAL